MARTRPEAEEAGTQVHQGRETGGGRGALSIHRDPKSARPPWGVGPRGGQSAKSPQGMPHPRDGLNKLWETRCTALGGLGTREGHCGASTWPQRALGPVAPTQVSQR